MSFFLFFIFIFLSSYFFILLFSHFSSCLNLLSFLFHILTSVCVCLPLFVFSLILFKNVLCFYFCLFPLCDHAPRRFFSLRFFAPISKPYTHKWRFNSPSNNVAKNSRKKSTKDDRQGLGIIQTEKIYKHKDLN